MAIIKQYHKDTNTTYVYESESYWDPELKQSRSRRTCIGKIDPETGEMIPTGRRGRKKTKNEASSDDSELQKVLSQLEEVKKDNVSLNGRIAALEKELEETSRELKRYKSAAQKAAEILSKL